MQSKRINIRGAKGSFAVTVIFDTGSDRTYVTEEVVRLVGLEYVFREPVAVSAFGNSAAGSPEVRSVYSVVALGQKGEEHIFNATAVRTICAPLCRPAVPDNLIASFVNHFCALR